MKKFLLTLLLLAVTFPAFAEVTGEIINTDIDDNGTIRVYIQYKVDGVEVETQYPKFEGKSYMIARYDTTSFANMTKLQALQRIKKDVDQHAKKLIRQTFLEKNNITTKSVLLNNIVGQKVTHTEAPLRLDTNGDGVKDKLWTVKTDGTKIETDIIIP